MRIFFLIGVVALSPASWLFGEESSLEVLVNLAKADPKPFVIVESSGKEAKVRGQGVVISPQGHVLSAGHVTWVDDEKVFSNQFRISFRGKGDGLPSQPSHVHKVVFSDREDTAFLEHYFSAKLLWQGQSRFVDSRDLGLFKLEAKGDFPNLDFFSKEKPSLKAGETLHLCHYSFPHKPGDPLFLINPIEVVGVTQTSSGLQYLAKGFYRVGSSGGAILKNGRLIGIQSAGYTTNTKQVGELPQGLLSFELVWSDLVKASINEGAEVAEE